VQYSDTSPAAPYQTEHSGIFLSHDVPTAKYVETLNKIHADSHVQRNNNLRVFLVSIRVGVAHSVS